MLQNFNVHCPLHKTIHLANQLVLEVYLVSGIHTKSIHFNPASLYLPYSYTLGRFVINTLGHYLICVLKACTDI